MVSLKDVALFPAEMFAKYYGMVLEAMGSWGVFFLYIMIVATLALIGILDFSFLYVVINNTLGDDWMRWTFMSLFLNYFLGSKLLGMWHVVKRFEQP